VIGEYGNNVMIYDSEGIILRHQIQAGTVVKSFEFTKNAQEIVLVTEDLRLRFYTLNKFEGTFTKELTTVHRSGINSLNMSHNGGYFLTGGEDNLLKVWDMDAQKSTPYYF
jgi:cilia- and flagella-associated protein 52